MNAPERDRAGGGLQDGPLGDHGFDLARALTEAGIAVPAGAQGNWSTDQLIAGVQQRFPDILYVLWRMQDGQHRCSLGWTEQDIDQNVWSAAGPGPSEALRGALACALADLRAASDS